MSGIEVARHKVIVYTIAGLLAGVAADRAERQEPDRASPAWASMYELDAIAMAVIGGISLQGGRGSIVGTVLGALIFGVIISGFTFLRLDAYYQEMVKGAIIVGAVVLDQWRQRRSAFQILKERHHGKRHPDNQHFGARHAPHAGALRWAT